MSQCAMVGVEVGMSLSAVVGVGDGMSPCAVVGVGVGVPPCAVTTMMDPLTTGCFPFVFADRFLVHVPVHSVAKEPNKH